MSHRRPPLAEIDAAALWQAVRRGDWQTSAPWVLLLAGFCAVLASMIAFFWLSAPGDMPGLIVLLGLFAAYLYRRMAAGAGVAGPALAALALITGLTFAAWWIFYELVGRNIWIGLGGVIAVAALGIVVGLIGINKLAKANESV